jgi:hypothetical protein
MTTEAKVDSTELMVISQADLDALASETGASQEDLNGGGGSFLPQFKVWSEDDPDDEGAPRRKGKLFITGQEPLVFAKANTVTFRPLTQSFQWTQWDDSTKTVTNKSRLVTSFKEEARDEKGTVKCGKPPSKDLKENKALKEMYDDITTWRRIQGFVSYSGVDEQGNDVEVKDVLVSINSKGASFTAFDEEFVKKMPEKSSLWDFNARITLSKEKNGAVTYWVMHYEGDFATKLPVNVLVFNTIKDLNDKRVAANRAIDKKYYEALEAKNGDNAAINALKNVGGGSSSGRPGLNRNQLDDDFDDNSIPF